MNPNDVNLTNMDRRSFLRLCAIMGFGLATTGLAGCGNSDSGGAGETRTIVDHTGEEVVIPAKIERVAITSITPLPSVYSMFRGGPKNLIGMSPSSMAAAKNSYLAKVYPDILDVDTGFYAGNDCNVEELVARKPDVVFYRTNVEGERERLQAAGLCAIGVSVKKGGFNAIDTFNSWIELLQQVFPEENHTKGIVEKGNEILAEIQSRVSDIPESERPRCIALTASQKGVLKVSGNTFFGDWWITSCGGINAASEIKGIGEISMEQIYQWNPDKILLNNFCSFLPENLYNNDMAGCDWSPVKAVKDKEVYKFPLGTYRWFPPSADTPMSLWWVAKSIHPELFKDIDLNQKVREYYSEYYNFDLTDDDLHAIFNPPAEAAGSVWNKK